MTEKTKKRLIKEYIRLTGESPNPSAHALLITAIQSPNDFFEWKKTDNPEAPYTLVPVDPFGFGIPEVKKGVEQEERRKLTSTEKNALAEVLPQDDRDKLLINHNIADNNSAKNILEGFGIERLIECYAEGITEEAVCQYLNIRPAQMTRWITISPQRIVMLQRLEDIKRSQKINTIIDETLNYQVGSVVDKASAAYESLKMDCQKLKSKTALDMEARARMKEQGQESTLPVVNLGLQVNVNTRKEDGSLSQAVPVLPVIAGSQD